jgi:anti-anti-sigma factor
MTNIQDRRPAVPSRFDGQPGPFHVELVPARDRVIVVPHGELDLATVGQLAAEIDELVGRGFDALVLDLRETAFMDSSGVHLLLSQTARPDADVRLIDGSGVVRRVIELAGVRHLLPFEASA